MIEKLEQQGTYIDIKREKGTKPTQETGLVISFRVIMQNS